MRIKLFESFHENYRKIKSEIDKSESEISKNRTILNKLVSDEKSNIDLLLLNIFDKYDVETRYSGKFFWYNFLEVKEDKLDLIFKELPFISTEFKSIIKRSEILYPDNKLEMFINITYDKGNSYDTESIKYDGDDAKFKKIISDAIDRLPEVKLINFQLKFYI
jgi:hypothetical protein